MTPLSGLLFLASSPIIFWLWHGSTARLPSQSMQQPRPVPAQLSNDGPCAAYWTDDVTPYRHGLPLGHGAFLPLYSSATFNPSSNPSITNAVVFVHGLSANANQYFCWAANASAAVAPPRGSSVLTIVPWFGIEQVTAPDWSDTALDGSPLNSSLVSLYWPENGAWIPGDLGSVGCSDADRPYVPELTSYGALDLILSTLLNTTLFPNLQLLTLAGLSAGGQTVQRYAWASPMGRQPTPAAPAPAAPQLRFIASSMSSYVYLSPRRPAPSCRPLRNTGSNHTCTDFREPSEEERAPCPENNGWKYGVDLTHRAGFTKMLSPYLHARLVADAGLSEELTRAYRSKRIIYALGSRDSCNCQDAGYENPGWCPPMEADAATGKMTCNPSCIPYCRTGPDIPCCDTYPDATDHNSFVTNCESSLQGTSRMQRGLNFAASLVDVFGPDFHPEVKIIHHMMHDAPALMASDMYRAYAFDPAL